jgi:23S rRNA pseudouridine2605 synthase
MEHRLQKIIADAGIASRRKAEQIILEGRVTVNGKPVSKLGSKADPARDHIRVDGRLLTGAAENVYLLVNKPVGYVSTVSDPERRPTVVSLVRGIKERVYPVGRLDYHSSGLMILTNDGELANFLMARASAIPRTYHVKLEGRPDPEDVSKLTAGIALDGRRTEPCEIRALGNDPKPWYEITLVEGRYHQVRRMFERIGKGVVKLKRVRIAFLTDKDLGPGQVRNLTRAEVEKLKKWKRQESSREKGDEAEVSRHQAAGTRRPEYEGHASKRRNKKPAGGNISRGRDERKTKSF